jgi:hypothetical protein
VRIRTLRSDYLFDVHLRTLSTNEPHPKAPALFLPAFSLVIRPNAAIRIVQVQISGNMLALLYTDRAFRALEILNWLEFPCNSVRPMLLLKSMKPPNILTVFICQCIIEDNIPIQDFCFLSCDTILISKKNGILEVFKVIIDSAASSRKAIMQVCYDLPRLGQQSEYAVLSIGRFPTAGTAYRDTILEAEETAGSGQTTKWMPLCYPRMDECVLGKGISRSFS